MVAAKGTSTTPTFSANTLINGAPWWLPTILTSVDHATTWQVVTGFGPVPTWSTTTAPTLAAPVSYPNFAPGASTLTTLALTGITSFNSQPLSLNSVFCATKSLCFAVGGFISGYPTSPLSIVQANIYTYGTVLVSTNGGTFWNFASMPLVPYANPATGATMGPPGGLLSVGVDSHARHIYAVCSPSFQFLAPTAGASVTINSVAITPYTGLGYTSGSNWATAPTGAGTVSGTILYSGNGGASFQVQSAPIVAGYFYQLSSVFVIKGTIAFAAGGNPFGTEGSTQGVLSTATSTTPTSVTPATLPTAANGIIIATVNGGFTWVVQTLSSYQYTCATANRQAGVCYVSGTTSISPVGTQANGAIPYINSIAFNQAYAPGVVKGGSNGGNTGGITGWAVGNDGLVYTTSWNSTTAPTTNTFVAPTVWTVASMGASFINVVQLSTGSVNLMGIVWDNAMVGYIYGNDIIMSTHNGGMTWVAETPNSIVTAAVPITISALGVVPTTY